MFTNLLARANYVKPHSPIDFGDYLTSSSGDDFIIGDDDNIYIIGSQDGLIYKMVGHSNTPSATIGQPTEYPHAEGWRYNSLSWYNGLGAMMYKINTDAQYVEFEGFTNTLRKNLTLSVVDPLWVGIDPTRGWLVGISTEYFALDGYKDYIVKSDYNTGAFIGYAGKVRPYVSSEGGGSYHSGWIDYENHILYAYRSKDNNMYWYDYTELTNRDDIYPLGSVTGYISEIGSSGVSLDVDGNFWGLRSNELAYRHLGLSSILYPY